MNIKGIITLLFISALLALAVCAAPVVAAGASFSQLNSFSRLNGFSDASGFVPYIPDTSGSPDDIIPEDPVSTRLFSSTGHNIGTWTIQPFIPDKTAAEFARTVGPRYCGYCGC